MQKYRYIRDHRLRAMCRALPCQHCASDDGTVTWAHSNQSKHGKGKSIKASDIYVAALCAACHQYVDQGLSTRAERIALWEAAHKRTVSEASRLGLWPEGIDIP